jgi:MFS transporter, SP family, arabinose:H+ symporter
MLFDVLALSSLILFVTMWTIGPGTVSQLVIAKIYPSSVRGVATGIATACLWAAYALAASTFLSVTTVLGDAGTFWFFGATALLAWIFAYRYLPETRGKSLEEIAAHWHRPVSGSAPAASLR